MDRSRRPEQRFSGEVKLPQISTEPLEFLARSWSPSSLHLSKALSPPPLLPPLRSKVSTDTSGGGNGGGGGGEREEYSRVAAVVDNSGNPLLSFSSASSATSQLVLQRIMSQSEISPLTSGRVSQSSSGQLDDNSPLTEDTNSPVVCPFDEFDDVLQSARSNNTLNPLFTGARNGYVGGSGGGDGSGVSTPSGKTVGRWLKERKEKKKQEARTHNAQLHAVVSVASVAAAVAAMAAATAAASATGKDDEMAKTDVAVASAATLVAAQCVEAAEAMGADRDHLISAIASAVSVRTHCDITTLTAAAATALRGAATLKARALKEARTLGAAVPAEKGMRMSGCIGNDQHSDGNSFREGLAQEENFLDSCHQQLLAKGTELLKCTRKGDLHWKIVSVYIHRSGQVMLKMKSRHVAGTMTKKNKHVVLEVHRDVKPWPGRHLFEGSEQRRYFGLKTATRGVIEFECKNQREYDIWTQGVRRLLSVAAEKNKLHN